MKLITYLAASRPLQKLVEQPMPLKKAWAVTRLVDKINPVLAFATNETAKCADQEAVEELYDMEIEDISIERISIPLSTDIRLCPTDVKALEPFIMFEEAETNE